MASSVRSDFVPALRDLLPLRDPLGPCSLDVTVGGLTVALSGFSPSQAATLAARYGAFASQSRSASSFRLRVVRAQREGFLQCAGGHELYRVKIAWEGSTLIATSYEWAGWFDREAGAGGLALGEPAETDSRAFDRSLENFLRVVFAHTMVPRGGFLLHGAGLVVGGKAFLFFGPSGSGKTTVTSLTPEALVLSDDLTLLMNGDDGVVRACSVPFRGVFAPHPVSIESFPVAGFFRLIQDTTDFLEPIQGAKGVGEVVGSLPFVTDRPEMMGEVIDAVARATGSAPVFRMHFRKDRTFWDEIRRAGLPGPAVDDFRAVRGMK